MTQPEFSITEDLIESCLKSIEESRSANYDYDSLKDIVCLYSMTLRISQDKNPLNCFKSIEYFLSSRNKKRDSSLELKFLDSLRFILARIHFLLSKIWKKVIIVTQKEIKVFSSATVLSTVYKTDDLIEVVQKCQDFPINLTTFNRKIQEIVENLHKFRVEVEENSEYCSVLLTEKEIDDQVLENLQRFISWTKFNHIEKIRVSDKLKKDTNFKDFLKKIEKNQVLGATNLLVKEGLIEDVENPSKLSLSASFCIQLKEDFMIFGENEVVSISRYFSEICLKFGINFNEKVLDLLGNIKVPACLLTIIERAYELLLGNSKSIRKKFVKVTEMFHMYLNTSKMKILNKLNICSFCLYVNSCMFIHFNLMHLKNFLLQDSTQLDLQLKVFYRLVQISKQNISEIFSNLMKTTETRITSELNSSFLSEDIKKYQLKQIIKEFRNSFDVIHDSMHLESSKFYIGKLFDLLLLTTQEVSAKFGLDMKKFSIKLRKMLEKYFEGNFKTYSNNFHVLMSSEEFSYD
jgi:hypothetical protein